jgi:hypothetical protein
MRIANVGCDPEYKTTTHAVSCISTEYDNPTRNKIPRGSSIQYYDAAWQINRCHAFHSRGGGDCAPLRGVEPRPVSLERPPRCQGPGGWSSCQESGCRGTIFMRYRYGDEERKVLQGARLHSRSRRYMSLHALRSLINRLACTECFTASGVCGCLFCGGTRSAYSAGSRSEIEGCGY